MITLYTYCNSLLRKHKGFSDGRVVSMTKNKYGFAVRFLYRLLYSSKYQTNNSTICLTSRHFGIFMMKKLLHVLVQVSMPAFRIL